MESPDSQSYQEAVAFLLELGRALHQYGLPAHRLEEAMARAADGLGVKGQFYSTPTLLIAAFREGRQESTKLMRVSPGEIHLEKMALLDEVGDRVIERGLTPAEGSRKIQEILDAPPPFPDWLTVLSFGVVSAAASTFFGAGWPDILPSGLVGLLIGAFAVWGVKSEPVARVYEAIAAFAATLIALALARILPGTSTYVVILAGLIVLIPGLSFTVAVAELATRNLVSGTVRLMDSLTVFLKIILGVALATQIGRLAGLTAPAIEPRQLPAWAILAALTLAPMGFTVLFRARIKDMGWILLAGFAAYFGTQAGGLVLGKELGLFCGGFIVGVGSNLYARYLKRPSAITRVPAIILLVPGIIGYKSLSLMLERDVVSSVETAFSMMIMAGALVGGLFFANIMASSRRSL